MRVNTFTQTSGATIHDRRGLALSLLQSALIASCGRENTRKSLANYQATDEFYLISIGKCALAMASGAHDSCSDKIISSLIITKEEPLDGSLCNTANVHAYTSSHPVPDERSLKAGQMLIDFIAATPESAKLVFLISGGTSSLVEVLNNNMSLDELAKANTWLLANDFSIHEINAIRKRFSLIKGGGLLSYIQQRRCDVKLISDVPGDTIFNIGSGLLFPDNTADIELQRLPKWLRDHLTNLAPSTLSPAPSNNSNISAEIIATNSDALRAITFAAKKLHLSIYWDKNLQFTEDVESVAETIVNQLAAGAMGVYLWGGEPTVTLPASPGLGGRNQHLALIVADKIQTLDNIVFLSAGSDGNDGNSQDAGAIVDGQTVQRGLTLSLDIDEYIQRADAGSFLAQTGDLINTGPTGTNVMDIMIAIKF